MQYALKKIFPEPVHLIKVYKRQRKSREAASAPQCRKAPKQQTEERRKAMFTIFPMIARQSSCFFPANL